jgi:DNA helicase-2/ATP-dependent DNA helicase PcrA
VQNYDQELISLRDQIAEARMEDVPPLVQQMERLQRIAARRAEIPATNIDVRSPYFGHLRLVESGRQRDVLIGNATYIDTERGVRVVDWRDAPSPGCITATLKATTTKKRSPSARSKARCWCAARS